MNTAHALPGFRESLTESARFGLRVFRAEIDVLDVAALIDTIERERVDVAILRIPAQALDALDALRKHGLAAIVADEIVHYETDLPAAAGALDESVTLRPAGASDSARLEALAREIFDGYVSHYNANPLFSPAQIIDGYGEWAASHVQGRDNSAAWFIESNGVVAGFSCYRVDAATGLAIGVLNGVLPGFRGRGVYRGMLRRMLREFTELGLGRFAIATQIQNAAVQHIWAAEGLVLARTEHTIHVNAMRGTRERVERVREAASGRT